ncbi:MAG: hypothetical protein ACYC6T_17230 [Thermoleophilia bacterium]
MGIVSTVVLVAVGALVAASFGAFSVTSLRERESRAAGISAGVALLGVLVLAVGVMAPLGVKEILAGISVVGALVLMGLFVAPIGRVDAGPRVPNGRLDERDTMFARAEFMPDTSAYEHYYAMRPENREADDRMRSLPGLLAPNSLMANELPYAAANASFEVATALWAQLEGEPAPEKTCVHTAEITTYVKALARYWGAHKVGITKLQPYHLYSHKGMPEEVYGLEVLQQHRFAIVLAVEVDRTMVVTGPEAPVTMETGRSYLESSHLAVQLATFIRSLGYSTTAHMMDRYSMIGPLVARDAGLGEIGRSGVLLTPDLGPRVRLSFVTTDLQLEPAVWRSDHSILDFCTICCKCAENCPSNSIPSEGRGTIDGALRWRIDGETCYRHWCGLGTDCSRCLAVCPYSHPDAGLHNLVRWANRRSGAARRVTLFLDDVFYGRRPQPRTPPKWIPRRSGGEEKRPFSLH